MMVTCRLRCCEYKNYNKKRNFRFLTNFDNCAETSNRNRQINLTHLKQVQIFRSAFCLKPPAHVFQQIWSNISYGTVLTLGLLHFAIFCKFSKKIRLKTRLSPEIFPDCHTFLKFFCNSPGLSTVYFFLHYGEEIAVFYNQNFCSAGHVGKVFFWTASLISF